MPASRIIAKKLSTCAPADSFDRNAALMKLVAQFLAVVIALAGCSRRMPPPSHSPSGKYILTPSISQKQDDPACGFLVIEIRDTAGKVLCHTNTGAPARGWTIEWTSDNQVIINSSKTGVQYWNRQMDGSWRKE